MRRVVFLFIISIFLYSCAETENTSSRKTNDADSLFSMDTVSKIIKSGSVEDTIKIGSKIITDELAGANYRKRAMLYFIVDRQDTSDFKCYVTESLDGKVGLELRFAPTKTYRKQMTELSFLLTEASKSFRFDSLQTIFLGRLISTGDLAATISLNYKPYKMPVSMFLLNSKLGEDFKAVLQPYNVSIASISTEKAFLVDKAILSQMSKMEIETTVPDKILDALVWIRLE